MAAFISPIAALTNTILSRVLPDKEKQQEAQTELAKMALSGELQQVAAQIEVNKVEAASASTWVAGWRPAFGWVGATGLAYQMVIRPLLTFTVHLCGGGWDAPPIELQDLIALCSTMLGFGAMRSYDKSQGTDSGH